MGLAQNAVAVKPRSIIVEPGHLRIAAPSTNRVALLNRDALISLAEGFDSDF